jgi:ABC-type nickel/cobalt efflux system permease component RcnA
MTRTRLMSAALCLLIAFTVVLPTPTAQAVTGSPSATAPARKHHRHHHHRRHHHRRVGHRRHHRTTTQLPKAPAVQKPAAINSIPRFGQ